MDSATCRLLDLPAELLTQVFLCLPWDSVLRCSSVCKLFRDLLVTSVELQYHIELGIAGYQDGSPSCQVPVSDRLELLRRTNKNWLAQKFQKRETITIEALISAYTLQGSVLMVGTSSDDPLIEAISGHILNSELVSTESHRWNMNRHPARARDFTIDPYQDLFVLIEERMDRAEKIVVSLRFKSLLVDRPHPKAQHELVSTVLSVSTSPRGYTITVVNEFVLLLITGQRVLVWNWLTGRCHARIDTAMPGAITEVIPLQRTAFMAFRQVEDIPKLEVYTFSAKEPTSDQPFPVLRAVYLFPSLQKGLEMIMQCRCDPPPFQYSHLVHPDISSIPIDTPSYLRRPFQIQETSRILVLAINIRPGFDTEDLTIFVPLQTFLSTNLDPEALQGEPQVIPASEWLPTSYILDDIPLLGQWVCYVYGTRFATLSTDSPGQHNLCIYDFNPATIAYLKHHQERNRSKVQFRGPEVTQSVKDQDFIEWTEGEARIALTLNRSGFTCGTMFNEPVHGNLPPLISISIEEINVGPNESLGVMIDDERVLLTRFNDDVGSTSIDVYTI